MITLLKSFIFIKLFNLDDDPQVKLTYSNLSMLVLNFQIARKTLAPSV